MIIGESAYPRRKLQGYFGYGKFMENKLKNMKDQIDIKEEPMLLADEDEDEGEYDISLLGLSD